MTMLAYCRGAISRHPGINAVWLVTMLALVLAGVPRWEVHRHAAIEDHHAFEPFSHEHLSDSPAADLNPEVGGAPFTHCHAAPSIAVALFPSDWPSLMAAALNSDIFPEPEAIRATNAGPPPQRPPIV
jgi:hypothetical protein